MQSKPFYLLLIVLCFVGSSCKQYYWNKLNRICDDNSVIIYSVKNCLNKDIKFIGTHHVGTPIYYQTLITKIDSLKKLGFIVYYEGINQDTIVNGPLYMYALFKKFYKIAGRTTSINVEYQRMADNSNGKWIVQPDVGRDSTDKNIDVSVKEIVEYYEMTFGRVPKEISEDERKKRYAHIKGEFRNNHIVKSLKESSSPKIVIIFGDGHRKPVIDKLRNLCNEP